MSFLEPPIQWTEKLYEQCREVARKGIVRKDSGLTENPNAWMYFYRYINEIPNTYGSGQMLTTPREFED